MEEKIWEYIRKLRDTSPLVHNITNYVVMNSSANALLAAGASPVMAHSEDEVEDMVAIAGALVINIGTLSRTWVHAMKKAIRQANRLHKPVVFDPVGAGATPYRNETIRELLQAGSVAIIRANASEIMAIVSEAHRTKGVDSSQRAENALESAGILFRKYGSVISVSGKTDYIISAGTIMEVYNGHEFMPRITGMGCSATAITGAFAAVTDNYAEAALGGMALMGVAGELAALRAEGPGSLQVHFYDILHNLTREEFLETVRLKIRKDG
jgi:hydroxyethylthiazole kinase